MKQTVGKPIRAVEVLSKSANMLSRSPALMLPQVVILVLALIGDIASQVAIVTTILSFVASFVVAGAYPSMVQAVLGGSPFSAADSMRMALNRFWTLLVAGILVGLLVIVGFIAVIVPGIIIATWYAYTVPAVMLENKGALEGMGASKAFGRDKKWSTFLMFLVIGATAIVVFAIEAGVSLASPVAGRVVYSLLSVPLDAWIAVIFTYTYITFGPSSVGAQPESPGLGMVEAPPAQFQQPSVPASPPADASSPAKFCRNCGTPVQPGSRFCRECGTAL
jgi:hypothetical protein